MMLRKSAPSLFLELSKAAHAIRVPRQGELDLILEAGNAWDRVIDIFSGDGVSAIVNLKELIIGGGGLFWLIKTLRGRRISSRSDSPRPGPGEVVIVLDDGTELRVPSDTIQLYQSVSIRRKARDVITPLSRDGVDEVRFESDREVTIALGPDDAPAFDVPEEGEAVLLDEETVLVVAIATAAFVEGNKWRLTEGDQTYHAAIEDEAFLARIEAGEAFRKGDMLRCRMRVVQSRREGGLHTERSVIEVLEHIPREIQLPLSPGEG